MRLYRRGPILIIDNGKTLAEQKLSALMSVPVVPDLLHVADEPLTIRKLSCRAGVPLSTAYREVKQLHEASLFEKLIMADHSDSRHIVQYHQTFECTEVSVTGDGLHIGLAGQQTEGRYDRIGRWWVGGDDGPDEGFRRACRAT